MISICAVFTFAFVPNAVRDSRLMRCGVHMSAGQLDCMPTIQLGRVTMYKKETCPYCMKARALLEDKYQLFVNYVDVEEPDQ